MAEQPQITAKDIQELEAMKDNLRNVLRELDIRSKRLEELEAELLRVQAELLRSEEAWLARGKELDEMAVLIEEHERKVHGYLEDLNAEYAERTKLLGSLFENDSAEVPMD